MQLLLRTTRSNGTPLNVNAAATGFKWPVGPDAVGQTVTAPDWNPDNECGGGLHGLLWGQGAVCQLHGRTEFIEWQVVEVAPSSPVVDLDGKVKTQSVIIRFSGASPIEACAFLKAHLPEGVVPSFDWVGDGCRTIAVRRSGNAIAGKGGTAISGDYGKSEVDEGGTAISGEFGYSYSKTGGESIAGDYGFASTWSGGKATVGDKGHAHAGRDGVAVAGACGSAEAGADGIAIVGVMGHAAAGRGGTLVFTDKGGDTHSFRVDGYTLFPYLFYKWDEEQRKPVPR